MSLRSDFSASSSGSWTTPRARCSRRTSVLTKPWGITWRRRRTCRSCRLLWQRKTPPWLWTRCVWTIGRQTASLIRRWQSLDREHSSPKCHFLSFLFLKACQSGTEYISDVFPPCFVYLNRPCVFSLWSSSEPSPPPHCPQWSVVFGQVPRGRGFRFSGFSRVGFWPWFHETNINWGLLISPVMTKTPGEEIHLKLWLLAQQQRPAHKWVILTSKWKGFSAFYQWCPFSRTCSS